MIQLKYLKVRIKICVEKDDDRYYAYCPELKGVHEDGDSVEDATQNAKESALVYIQSILEHNESLPLCAEEVDMSFSSLMSKVKSAILFRSKPIVRFEDLNISDLSYA